MTSECDGGIRIRWLHRNALVATARHHRVPAGFHRRGFLDACRTVGRCAERLAIRLRCRSAAIFLAAIVRGFSGFGFSLLSITAIALILPVAQIVPSIFLLEIAASHQPHPRHLARRFTGAR